MATRQVRLGVTVGVPDSAKSVSELRDGVGVVIRQAAIGTRFVPAGELVELDAAEANALEARWPWQPTEIVDASVTRMQSAPPERRVVR